MRVESDGAVGPYERVVIAGDAASGLRCVVAVHSTALGPGVGGTRFRPYASEGAAVVDCLRLAAGMTFKSAAAGIDLGGGKAVIVGDSARLRSEDLWRAFAAVIDLFEGRYQAAEDVGTSEADMDRLARYTSRALGRAANRNGDPGDPSPYTADGVVAAMRAAWEELSGARDLAGARVLVQGVGKVGAEVARQVAAEGARLAVSDTDDGRALALADELGAEQVAPGEALAADCDILSPCALGGLLDRTAVPALRCRLVVGAANNQLATDEVAELLAAAGILYVPDFIANAGGIVSIAQELVGWDRARLRERVAAIGERVRGLLARAQTAGATPLAVARELAEERLAAAALRSPPPRTRPPSRVRG